MRVILRLVTYEDYNNRESIRLLTQWRKKNSFAYEGNYKITQRSVRQWLKDFVLDNPDRFLFWVIVDGEKIGHIGIKNIKHDSVEIDNVARGLDGYKGAMSKALKQIIEVYSDRRIWLRVLIDNEHAVRFYIKHGFIIYLDNTNFFFMEYENNLR